MADATAPPSRAGAITVLLITTLAFAVCFAAWMMFGVLSSCFMLLSASSGFR